jgi:hypothetical protein
MKPQTFAKLVEVIEDIIGEENDDREQLVYPDLAIDMAEAAKTVYDACLRGQKYAESQSATS